MDNSGEIVEGEAVAAEHIQPTSTECSVPGLDNSGIAASTPPRCPSPSHSVTSTTSTSAAPDSIARRTRNKVPKEVGADGDGKSVAGDEGEAGVGEDPTAEERRVTRSRAPPVPRTQLKSRDNPDKTDNTSSERGDKEADSSGGGSIPRAASGSSLLRINPAEQASPSPTPQIVSQTLPGPSTSILNPNSTSTPNSIDMNIHPRKRKLKTGRASEASTSGSCPQEGSSPVPPAIPLAPPIHFEKPENPYQLYLSIRSQLAARRNNVEVIQPKAPAGYKDYLLVNGNYVLAGRASSRLSVPLLSPPSAVTGAMKDLFVRQEEGRYELRLQHVIERQKLCISAEQEMIRVNGRAAHALAKHPVSLSFCSILKDENTFNAINPEQEHKEKDSRSRFNGRLFLAWHQEVSEKFEKIKEGLLWRHHHEAESLNAVQKLEWMWHMHEAGLADSKTSQPVIDDLCVPMVTVTDDFELLPN